MKESCYGGNCLKYSLKYRVMKKWFKNHFNEDLFEHPVESQTNWTMVSIFTSEWKERQKRKCFGNQKWYDKYHF